MAIDKEDIISGIGAALTPLGGGLAGALAGKSAKAGLPPFPKKESEEAEETPQQRSERMDESKRESRGVKRSRRIEIPPELKAKGGTVKSVSARADGFAKRGKTRGRIV